LLITDRAYGWGRQTVTISQNGQSPIVWSFITSPAGPLPSGRTVTVHVAPGAQTVLANLTVTGTTGAGHTTVYPCLAGRPSASNSNYVAGQTVANFVVAPSDANGDLCIYTSGAAQLIWDQVGATTAFPVNNAARLLDTRSPHPSSG
jgi:hypothetical protein